MARKSAGISGKSAGSGARPASGRVPFGFADVTADEKPGLVDSVFDRVAGRYDLMNDLMSGGIHRLWKARLMDMAKPRPGGAMLDVGGGTGDLAFRFLERGGAHVTVCDVNRNMLAVGRDRALDRGYTGEIEWLCGRAEALPVADSSAELYVTAFCLRNVTGLEAALAEARRVLAPGGRFLCLEFSRVGLPALAKLYDAYSFNVLPLIGQVVAGDRDAYQYLVESIRRFPDQETFSGLMEAAGLERARHVNLSGGIAAIHAAWRL